MNCNFDERIIHLYADGELGETARARVEYHFAACPECTSRYKSILLIKNHLQEACAGVKAPAYLKTRIAANIDNIEQAKVIKFGLIDKLVLALNRFKPSRVATIGFLFAAVMLFVLLPDKQGLSEIAGNLANEYMAWSGSDTVESISITDPEEAEAYLKAKVDFGSHIPGMLTGGMKLIGVGAADLNGYPVAHVRYSNGKMECSMFIFRETEPGHKLSSTLMAAGQEYEISSSADVNLLCWHKNELNYVLCGCCCFEKLSEMARSGI